MKSKVKYKDKDTETNSGKEKEKNKNIDTNNDKDKKKGAGKDTQLSAIQKYEKFNTSYRTTQTSLQSIVHNNKTIDLIDNNVIMTNKIIRHTFTFSNYII